MLNKNARRWCLFLLLWPVWAGADTESYRVEKVYDGDTVLLDDGRKIRFLGINTPEIAHGNQPEEAGGEQARLWLQQRIEHKNISLEGDNEAQDKYGRSLAYVFDQDRRQLNLQLVANGLATVSIFPPNLKYTDALLAAQQSAEQTGLGIWGYAEYAPLPFQELTADNYHGWKRITGRIQAIKQGANSFYLQFSEQAALRVDSQYAALFPPLESYVGKNLEVRGWLYRSKDRFTLPVRHPGQIKVLD